MARREVEEGKDATTALKAVRSEAQEAAAAFGVKMRAKLTKLETPVVDRREEDERQVCLLTYYGVGEKEQRREDRIGGPHSPSHPLPFSLALSHTATLTTWRYSLRLYLPWLYLLCGRRCSSSTSRS